MTWLEPKTRHTHRPLDDAMLLQPTSAHRSTDPGSSRI